MNGLLSRAPYPVDTMKDCIAVAAIGSTLVLTRPDPQIQTVDGGVERPSQIGDVLSRQPDGTWQGRPQGANAAWEQVAVNGALAVYDALGTTTGAEAFLYWPGVPNV